MLKIDRPILVEGKYDKIKLESVVEAKILTTDGFGIFKKAEKVALIRRLAMEKGLIVITDSDGAGLVIRNYLNAILPKEKIIHLYIPEIVGKEKRKKVASKEGLLGVEGVAVSRLHEIFAPFAEEGHPNTTPERNITKLDFYEDGLSGSDQSAFLRRKLAQKLGLPTNLSANALLTALNLLYSYSQYEKWVKESME